MQGLFSIEFLVAIFGASFQELLYWNSVKKKLSLESVQLLFKSVGYWGITLSVILASAFGVMIWFSDSSTYNLKDYALMGAAFPALFKLGVSSLSGGDAPKLGGSKPTFASTARNYFFPERNHE